jgi:branched-chain amino acid aminotransferase
MRMASLVWYDGRWYDEPPRLLSPLDHAFFMATSAFDGARAFGGNAPDLDLHCARLIASTRSMLLEPPMGAEAIEALCREGIRRFPPDAELYIRPMMFARRGWVAPDPSSTDVTILVDEMRMPEPGPLAVGFSSYRRPARDMAPTDAKAGCLYPNMQRALFEAKARGFENAVTFDPNGNVAELATANLWIVKDGRALTPAANGTFLAGITRNRVLELLQRDGIPAREAVLSRQDVLDADEVFTTGNFAKVLPITRVEDRSFQPGPIAQRARELYWEFAASQPVG